MREEGAKGQLWCLTG